MGILFNADEVFEMAEQIERNGAKFYRRAAAAHAGQEGARFLEGLAAMEDDHERTFQAMRQELLGSDAYKTYEDKGEPIVPYLQDWVEGFVFDLREDPSEKLKGTESLAEIIQTAIGLEKESIIFYLGLKDHLPKRHGRDKIDAIINEEMKHITTLNVALTKLKKQ